MIPKTLLPALLATSLLSLGALGASALDRPPSKTPPKSPSLLPPRATPVPVNPPAEAPAGDPAPGGSTGTEITPEIIGIAQFAVFAQARKGPTRSAKPLRMVKVLKVESQVVAGTNYSITMSVEEGKTAREAKVVVYEDLKGNRSLSDWAWTK